MAVSVGRRKQETAGCLSASLVRTVPSGYHQNTAQDRYWNHFLSGPSAASTASVPPANEFETEVQTLIRDERQLQSTAARWLYFTYHPLRLDTGPQRYRRGGRGAGACGSPACR